MAGKIVADIIEAPAGRISLNVANVTVASINASGLYTSTGNLIISQANQIGTAAIVDGAVTNAKLTLAANASNIKTALNASGDAPIFAARAWVNFNGTGTPAIRGSGNISSITDVGSSIFDLNFTTAMSDSNYVVCGLPGDSGAFFGPTMDGNPINTSTARVSTRRRASASGNDEPVDYTTVSVAIFR